MEIGKEMLDQRMSKRVQKEIKQLQTNPPPGVRLISADVNKILLELKGANGTLYAGETWILQMVLGNYPFER